MPYFEYGIRVPTASSIYPRATSEETLCAMIDANELRPVHKRLPIEVLLLVNKEVHPINSLYEEIRSTWTTLIAGEVKTDESRDYLREMLLDKRWKTYFIIPQDISEGYRTGALQNKMRVAQSISSADLLYRLRCFFPEIRILSRGRYACKSIWSIIGIQHKQTGIIFVPSEYKGAAYASGYPVWRATLTEEDGNAFTNDAIRLMNAFSERVDGKHLAYFHPAADADYPTPDERFISDPGIQQNRLPSPDVAKPYTPWHPASLSPTDIPSSQSLLQKLNYNVESRSVDVVNLSTANLTTIISSSLLFYRLLCHYIWEQDNIYNTPPITSVWQVKLAHRRTGTCIIFMDDRGLFDIKAAEDAKEVMDDIIALVTALCSDECSHPYDGVVAGSVA